MVTARAQLHLAMNRQNVSAFLPSEGVSLLNILAFNVWNFRLFILLQKEKNESD
jgi:hypothetical protein